MEEAEFEYLVAFQRELAALANVDLRFINSEANDEIETSLILTLQRIQRGKFVTENRTKMAKTMARAIAERFGDRVIKLSGPPHIETRVVGSKVRITLSQGVVI